MCYLTKQKGMESMKLVQINATCGGGSTGKICVAISRLLTERHVENYILYATGHSDHPLSKRYMNPLETKIQAFKSRIYGNYGFNSKKATKRMIDALDEICPDMVHLHNLHGHNCDLQMLFAYLKKKQIKVFWTFHDCWTFTGYCPHYDMVGCGKWKTSCEKCPQRRYFSWFFDRSHYLFEKKKELFTGIDMTIVAPSQWLAEQVKQSFLYSYPIKVITNGIDLTVFSPTQSDFRKQYHCENRYIVLGVAFGWGPRKGLDVFIELYKRLDDRFQIVLVGTDEKVDKQLPDGIISIHRTQNQKELAGFYSAADVFVNPTREEVLGLTNLEALACGTPVVTFATGGSPECISDRCGIAVPKNDIEGMHRAILSVVQNQRFSKEACTAHARNFSADEKFRQYLDLYFRDGERSG